VGKVKIARGLFQTKNDLDVFRCFKSLCADTPGGERDHSPIDLSFKKINDPLTELLHVCRLAVPDH